MNILEKSKEIISKILKESFIDNLIQLEKGNKQEIDILTDLLLKKDNINKLILQTQLLNTKLIHIKLKEDEDKKRQIQSRSKLKVNGSTSVIPQSRNKSSIGQTNKASERTLYKSNTTFRTNVSQNKSVNKKASGNNDLLNSSSSNQILSNVPFKKKIIDSKQIVKSKDIKTNIKTYNFNEKEGKNHNETKINIRNIKDISLNKDLKDRSKSPILNKSHTSISNLNRNKANNSNISRNNLNVINNKDNPNEKESNFYIKKLNTINNYSNSSKIDNKSNDYNQNSINSKGQQSKITNNTKAFDDPSSSPSFGASINNKIIVKIVKKEDIYRLFKSRIINLFPFFDKELINILLITSKDIKILILNQILSLYRLNLKSFQLSIQNYKDKYQIEELLKPIPSFSLSKGAEKAIEFLNEKLYNGIFTDSSIPKKDILIPYRILFQLINLPDLSITLNDIEFWRRLVSYFRSEANGKIGTHLKELTNKLDFTDSNIYSLSQLIYGNQKKLTPTFYTKLCSSTGFVMFYLKDILDYLGLVDEKKCSIQRVYKNLLYKEKEFQRKINQISSIL